MKNKYSIVLVALVLCFVTKSFCQKGNYRITNGVGITAAISKFDIITENFTTTKGDGYLGGLSATVDIPLKWYNISYGMQFSQNNFGISARPTLLSTNEAFLDYKLLAVQLALMGHLKLIKNYLTIDIGPMLQYNGNLELNDKNKEGYYINNYDNLTAKDIVNISNFNINGAIGASAGYKYIKLKAQYIYGITNMFKNLNKQDLDTVGSSETMFKGNQNMLVFGVLISF